jgi:hypothetical protein
VAVQGFLADQFLYNFFGFFGALKKGDFFGVRPKKVSVIKTFPPSTEEPGNSIGELTAIC